MAAEAPVPADLAALLETARLDPTRHVQDNGDDGFESEPEARAEGVRPAPGPLNPAESELDAHAEAERPWCLVSENASEVGVLRLE